MSQALDDSLRAAPAGARPEVAATGRSGRGASIRRAATRVGGLLGLNQSTTLARRFLLASLLVLVVGGLLAGWWIGNQLSRGIIDQNASVTGLYVESFIQPHLQGLDQGAWLTKADVASLDTLLSDTAFGQKIVALKVWRPDGVVVYSPDRELIGEKFDVDEELQQALNGTVVSSMSTLENEENVDERARGFDRLVEMYIPVRGTWGGPGVDRIIGAAEFYQLPNEIDQEVQAAQLQSWLAVAAAVGVVYLFLFGIVRGGSNTIRRQQVALQEQVTELQTLLDQNEQLRERSRLAAERNTTLSEAQLRRISSDLHDGPGQMIALAALRLDEIERATDGGEGAQAAEDVRDALNDALRDMRAIAAGLRLPGLRSMSTADAVRRAVDDHQRRTSVPVALSIGTLPAEASLSTKIALFRAAQELLSNATRHGQGKDVSVALEGDAHEIRLTVADGGPGFDPARVGAEGHLGLAGIREQSQLLGGQFEVSTPATGGAAVTVRWPL